MKDTFSPTNMETGAAHEPVAEILSVKSQNPQKRFEAFAEQYDIFPLAVPHYEKLETAVGSMLAEKLQGTTSNSPEIIELGTGTGITTEKLLQAIKGDIRVISIDNEPKMTAQARKKIIDSRATFIEADAFEYLKSLPDNHAEAIVSAFMLHNLEPQYRARIITETARVLKSNGIFINGDKYARNNPIDHLKDISLQLKRFDVFLEKGSEEYWAYWFQHYLDDDHIKFTESEQRELLQPYFSDITFSNRYVMEAICASKKK